MAVTALQVGEEGVKEVVVITGFQHRRQLFILVLEVPQESTLYATVVSPLEIQGSNPRIVCVLSSQSAGFAA